MQRMATNGADFTLTFRRLCDAVAGSQGDEEYATSSLMQELTTYGLLNGADAWRKSPCPRRRASLPCGWQIRHTSHGTTW